MSLVQAPGPLLSTSLRSACENPLREHKAGQVEFICVAAAWGGGGVNSHSWGRRGIPSFYFLLGIKMNADKLGCHLLSGVTLHAFKSVCLIEHTQQPPPPQPSPHLPNSPIQEGSLTKMAVKCIPTSSSSHLPKAVPAKGPRRRSQRQNADVCERARSRAALITVKGGSCFQSCVFLPRGPCFTLFPQLYFQECFPDCPP